MTIFDMVKAGAPPVVLHDKIDTVIVHGSVFHADEVTLVALIKECHNPNVEVIRTNNLDKYKPGNGVLIADIGEEYDGEWQYDHHQIIWDCSNPDEARSSIGLFWDDWCDNKTYYKFTTLVREIDKYDNIKNGPYQLPLLISEMNPSYECDHSENTLRTYFDAAVNLMRVHIRARLSTCLTELRADHYIKEHCKIDNGILIVDSSVPWRHFVYQNNIRAVISRGRTHGYYKIYPVRQYFPKHWVIRPTSRPKSVTWIHAGRFVCECNSFKSAMYIANKYCKKYKKGE